MAIKAAIFDADGTLLDSMLMWANFGSGTVRSVGEEPEEGLDLKIRYFSLRETAEYLSKNHPALGTADDVEALCKRNTKRYYESEVGLKKGVRELLEFLSNEGVKCYVATATYAHLITAALKANDIWKYFEGIVTCAEVGAGKDKPDVFFAATKALGVDISHTWVFEDALHAMKTAKAAGYKVCGVYDITEFDHQTETREVCDIYVDSFTELDTNRLK